MQYRIVDENNALSDQQTVNLIVGIYGDIPSGVLTPPSPDGFVLHAPGPNPFNPRTEIAFRTDAAGHVELRILDLRGRLVATIVDEDLPAGDHTAGWPGTDDRGSRMASGSYIAELRSAGQRAVQKLTLMK